MHKFKFLDDHDNHPGTQAGWQTIRVMGLFVGSVFTFSFFFFLLVFDCVQMETLFDMVSENVG